MRPEANRYCAIVPAFRESARVAGTVAAILRQGIQAIVVDDGSDDDTAGAAAAAGAIVVRHPGNRGKGAALLTGFREARARGFEVAVTIDADGQHDPAEIPKFIEAYERTGIPVLIGNRLWNPAGMPWIRRTTNRFMSWLLSREMGLYVPDTQCGYRLFRCDLIPHVETRAERFAAESEVLLHIAARGIAIDSVRIRTIYGDERSKINPVTDTVRFYRMLRAHRRTRHTVGR
jgi:glycosyltransferase involved in cell wall biosynthesis